MATIKRKDAMNMVATMCAGIFANPCSGNILYDPYARQQAIEQMINVTGDVLAAAGIDVVDEKEGSNE